MRYSSQQGFNLSPVLVLIIINFLVYIAFEVGNRFIGYDLGGLLGLIPISFLYKPWTIVTNLFVHSSIWHLLFNMLTLYFLGSFLTRLLGTRILLIVYFLGGILGNIFVLLLEPHLNIPVIGASGAIFALGGVLTVLVPKLRVIVFPIPVPIPLWAAIIGIFFLLTFAAGFLPISWQGHLGGLILGLIAGALLRRRGRPIY